MPRSKHEHDLVDLLDQNGGGGIKHPGFPVITTPRASSIFCFASFTATCFTQSCDGSKLGHGHGFLKRDPSNG